MSTNKEIVHQINVAFSKADLQGFLTHCTESIRWIIIGKEPIVGKAAITAFMGTMPGTPVMSFDIHDLFGEGAHVACNGLMEMPKQDGSHYKAAFCDVYRFDGDKVAEMRSYVVDLKG